MSMIRLVKMKSTTAFFKSPMCDARLVCVVVEGHGVRRRRRWRRRALAVRPRQVAVASRTLMTPG